MLKWLNITFLKSNTSVTQSESDRACILLLRLQRRNGSWLWVVLSKHFLIPLCCDQMTLVLQVGAHGAAGEGSDRGDDLPRDCVHKPDPLPWRGRGDEGQLLALPLLHGSEQAAVRSRLWSPLTSRSLLHLLSSRGLPILWAKLCWNPPSLLAGCSASLSPLRLSSNSSLLPPPATRSRSYTTPLRYQRPLTSPPWLQQKPSQLGKWWCEGETRSSSTLGLPSTPRLVLEVSQLEVWFLRFSSWTRGGRWRLCGLLSSSTGRTSLPISGVATRASHRAWQAEKGGAGGV